MILLVKPARVEFCFLKSGSGKLKLYFHVAALTSQIFPQIRDWRTLPSISIHCIFETYLVCGQCVSSAFSLVGLQWSCDDLKGCRGVEDFWYGKERASKVF